MSNYANQRIALFMPSLRGGGAERVMVTLAREFVAKGYLVDLVLVKAEGPYLKEVPENVNIIDLKASRTVFSLYGLIRYLKKVRPQALLSTLPNTNLIAVIAKILSRVKVRIILREANTLSANVAKHKRLSDKLMPLFMRLIYPFSDQIIAVSKGVSQDLIQELKLSESKVTVVYSPVVSPFIFEKANEPLNHPWFSKGEPPVVIGVGRLTRQKGFDVLIEAVSKVRETIPVRLMILGEGSDREKLELLIKQKQLENEIALPGFVPNPFSYMKKSAVFVLSSRWEGLPNTLIQAMALGIPVVSTDCPSGPNEILEDDRWGALVKMDDVEGMASCIRKVLDSKPLSKNSGISEYCTLMFGCQHSAESYLDVFFES